MIEPDADILLLFDVLDGESPDPIHVCDVMLLTALERGDLAISILPGEVLSVKIGTESVNRMSPGTIGRFRVTLARLGHIFDVISKMSSGPKNLEPVGRIASLREHRLNPSEEWEFVRASFLQIPGSPCYSVNGELVLRNSKNSEMTIIVKMQNTGASQSCALSRQK